MKTKLHAPPIAHIFQPQPEDSTKTGCFWCGCREDKHPVEGEEGVGFVRKLDTSNQIANIAPSNRVAKL